MTAYFNLNNNEISKELLVNKCNMILNNQGSLCYITKKHLRHTMNHRDLVGLFRSSHRRCSVKKGVLKNFANFTGKHLYWSLRQACNFIKKRLQHWCFPVKFAFSSSASSAFTLLEAATRSILISDNLLTGHHKIDLCFIKSSFQIYQFSFLNKRLIEVFVYILN